MGRINKKSAVLTARLGPGQKKKLVALAAKREVTLQQIVRDLVAEAVANP